ncbi:MAG: YebC/PmpR family DNA-binding transcriptional regulator [Patescibacteria group bacterium]
MSRHSKWSKIKHHKGPADVKRGAMFTKLAKNITVAAREGGGNPEFNFKLRMAIDQARAGNMPKDNVERAINKGAGDPDGAQIETVYYEGFGPGGVAVLVEALTDNRNRTSGTIKHAFSVHGGNMAGVGAVKWMFEAKGVVRAERESPLSESEELALIDAGADDISLEDGELAVTGNTEGLIKLKEAADKAGLKVESAEIEWIAKENVLWPEAEARKNLEEMLGALEDDEDVNAVYSNLA